MDAKNDIIKLHHDDGTLAGNEQYRGPV